ncbi:hypothetical protein BpHYR1_007700 [Brachionus plicatilis]|uniref:Uncharacterized protein n=1 Tax=Brachionus plicatilis TaxID=10195 RepID=A0A3M7PAE2_BRAPC|nr:hypothetical protein BpHYR1_007700 [Brachionus plicatilis]
MKIFKKSPDLEFKINSVNADWCNIHFKESKKTKNLKNILTGISVTNDIVFYRELRENVEIF